MKVTLYEITAIQVDVGDVDYLDGVDAAYDAVERGEGEILYTELDPNNWDVE